MNAPDAPAKLLPSRRAPWMHYLSSVRSNPVARNSAYMMASQVSLAVLQALQFFLLARALGSHEFGRVASIVAITSIFLPFCGLGLGNIAIMHIARGHARGAQSLGNGLLVTTLTAALAVALAMAVGEMVLGEPGTWRLVLLFGVSELLLTKYIDLAAHVFHGLERHVVSATFYNLHMLVRLGCSALLLWGWTASTAMAWAQLHLAAGVITALLVLWVSIHLLGRPRTDLAQARADIRKGVFFSIVISARGAQVDIDKIVLGRSSSAGVTGAYTAAVRLIYMACVPMVAILTALMPNVFRDGHRQGLRGTLHSMRMLLLVGGTYCPILAVALYLGAPAVPRLLGESYALSSQMLQWMCLLPFFFLLQAVGSNALSGADAQRRVGLLHALAAGVTLALNLWLVPAHGWQGAVIAAYASQAFLVAGLAWTIMQLLQRGGSTHP